MSEDGCEDESCWSSEESCESGSQEDEDESESDEEDDYKVDGSLSYDRKDDDDNDDSDEACSNHDQRLTRRVEKMSSAIYLI